MLPLVRLRRNRRYAWLRSMIAETGLQPSDLILPIFVIEGESKEEPIKSMPGVSRLTHDLVVKKIKEAEKYGIKAVALFPSIDEELKSEKGDEAYSLDNLICRTIRKIRNAGVNIGIICDVALDPYTTHGHDGIVVKGDVDNDATVDALCKQALVLAKAGADILAPSDMMDGRVEAIRNYIDEEGFHHVPIMSYAAKYASNFYGPFREAVKSNKLLKSDKKSYQMDFRNSIEAIQEVEIDLAEGADMVMIKPGMPYLDVISKVVCEFNIPVFAYQVSGEYSMMKIASQQGCLDWDKVIYESLIAFKRAGCRGIFTYAALDVAKKLKEGFYEE